MPLPSLLRPPISARLRDAILSLQPTAYWPLDDGSGPLRDASNNWSATVTGSPTYGVAAPSPIGRSITSAGTPVEGVTSGSVPTPASSVSVLCWFATTNASASNRFMVSRVATNQGTWGLFLLGTSQTVNAFSYQSNATENALAGVSGAVNDGLWHLAALTMDGTTLRCYRDDAAPGTDATLSGTWHKPSTAGIYIGSRNAAAYWVGSLAHVAYWADRVLTAAELGWVYRIGKGG